MSQTRDITPSIISEYEKNEDSLRWYYAFLGDLYEKEPHLSDWINRSGAGAIMGLGQKYTPVFAQFPILAHDMRLIMEQWFVRGFYMGMRKYTEQLNVGLGVFTPLSEPQRAKKEREPENWGETEEVEPEDFDPPQIEEIKE